MHQYIPKRCGTPFILTDIPDKIVAINQEEGNIYYLMTWKHDME